MRRVGTVVAVLVGFASLVHSQNAPVRPFIVVLDPGHGGEDAGVRAASGLEEKQLTLDIARLVRSVLDTQFTIRAVMTRDDDHHLTADERAGVANGSGGGLFISLHANAAPAASVTGAEIYYQALAPATGEDAAADPLVLIPWDGAQARHLDLSARAAGIFQDELQRVVPITMRPPRQAPLRGLVGVNMPALLVEMLFLTSPEQADAAAADLKERLANALAEGAARVATGAEFVPTQ